jgi:excisionase family DNA binding protein
MSVPKIADALRTIAREIPPALEFLASELEARAAAPTAPAAIEMVSIARFAREHSLHAATVRQMAKDGRIEAVRVGKRQWRVRRDSPIGQPMARGATSADTPAERARRLVEKLR